MEGAWFIPEYVDYNKVGLCFETSKVINIPLNLVQKDRNNYNMNISIDYLLAQFNKGLVINIDPFHKIMNTSPHMEYDISLIQRQL